MAKTLSQAGIETSNTVEAWHVTQSIDAFTGVEAYDITLSGSLVVTGSITGSLYGTSSWAQNTVSASYATTASYAPNFANSDLTFTGNREHFTSGSGLEINTNGNAANGSVFYMDSDTVQLINKRSGLRVAQNYIDLGFQSGLERALLITGSELVINEDSFDRDFRIESNNNSQMFLLDAGTDRIGIGKSSPNSSLDISGSLIISGSIRILPSATPSNNAGNILLYNNTTGQVSYNSTSSIFDNRTYSTSNSLGGTITFTHNLNSSYVGVYIKRGVTFPATPPYDVYSPGVDYTYAIVDNNNISITSITLGSNPCDIVIYKLLY